MINTQVPSGIIINILIIIVVIIIVMMIWAYMLIKIAYSSKCCWHKRDTRERLLARGQTALNPEQNVRRKKTFICNEGQEGADLKRQLCIA